MTFSTFSIIITLFLPLIGSKPITIPDLPHNDLSGSDEVVILKRFATRAEGDGGGIGVGAIAGIIIAVLIITLILIFIFIHRRRRSSLLPTTITHGSPPAYTSPPTKMFYSSQQAYPTLPKYTGPTATQSAAYVNGGGLRFPSAIHPSLRGYYSRSTRGGGKGVRFGEVGVRGY